MKTKINYKLDFSILDRIQYFLSIFIPILFSIGLIPTLFDNIYPTLIIVLIIQILISLIRLRLLNIFIELILIGLSVLSLIPLLGYIFRFIAIIFSILDMSSFKSPIIYKKFEFITFKTKSNNGKRGEKFKNKSKFSNADVKDVEFKEK